MTAPVVCASHLRLPGATVEPEPDDRGAGCAGLGDNVEFLESADSWLTLIALASRERTGARWVVAGDDGALFGRSEVRWALSAALPRP